MNHAVAELLKDKRRLYLLILVVAITALLLFLIFFTNRQPADPGVNYSTNDANGKTEVFVESELDDTTKQKIENQVKQNQPTKEISIDVAAPYSDEATEINNLRIPNPEEIDEKAIYPDNSAVDGPPYD